jgi:acyl-coenzyme A thioesterase PaaI-like protein
MSIRFLAPCLTDAFAKAEVIKVGRTLCPVTVNLFDARNKHIALAQVTYILLNNSKSDEKPEVLKGAVNYGNE